MQLTLERLAELRRRLEEARGYTGALAWWAEEHGEELLEMVLDLDRRLAYYEPDMYVKRCSACHGRGRREYPDTSTWRGGGYAGQAITVDICDRCWGTGDEGRPGTDLRSLIAECRNLMTEQRRLQHLRRLTNDALDAAEAAGIEDAVNWGDLSCVEAALVLTDEGRSYYRVMIEEASPDAYHLGVYVRNWLAKHGWTDVEVLTEW